MTKLGGTHEHAYESCADAAGASSVAGAWSGNRSQLANISQKEPGMRIECLHPFGIVNGIRTNMAASTSCAEPCYDCARAGQAPDAAGSIIGPPKLERIDWNGIAGLIAIQPGARLRLQNLHLASFAIKENSDDIGTSSPYKNVGAGPGIAPTMSLAPGAVVSSATSTGLRPRLIHGAVSMQHVMVVRTRGIPFLAYCCCLVLLPVSKKLGWPLCIHRQLTAFNQLATLQQQVLIAVSLDCCVFVIYPLQFVGVNLTAVFENPSEEADCPGYTDRTRSFYAQVRQTVATMATQHHLHIREVFAKIKLVTVVVRLFSSLSEGGYTACTVACQHGSHSGNRRLSIGQARVWWHRHNPLQPKLADGCTVYTAGSDSAVNLYIWCADPWR